MGRSQSFRCLLATAIVAFQLNYVIGHLFAQESERLIKSAILESAAVAIDGRGRLSAVTAPEGVVTFENARFQTLLSERLVSDLELAPEQIDQLKREAKRIDRVSALFAELKRSMSPSLEATPDALRIAGSMDEERKAIQQAVRDCLLPHQQRRLAQLEARQSAAETGLEAAILRRLSKDAPSDGATAASLLPALGELRGQAADDIAAIRRQVRYEIDRILTRKQRELLELECGDYAQYLAPAREILNWQFLQPKPASADKVKLEPVAELYFAGTQFRTALGGGVDQPTRVTLDPFHQFWKVFVGEAYGRVDIVDFQILAAVSPKPEESERYRVLRGKLRTLNGQESNGTVSEEFGAAEAAKLIDEFHLWMIATRIGELLPHQQQEIDRVILRRLIAVRGIKLCLTNGALGDLLGVSAEQKRLIEEMAARMAKKIEESSRIMEHKIWDGIRSALSPQEREQFTAIYGAHSVTERIMPSPDLLLMAAPQANIAGAQP